MGLQVFTGRIRNWITSVLICLHTTCPAQNGEVFLNQGSLRGNPIFLENQRLLIQLDDRVSFWDIDRNLLLKQYNASNQFVSGTSRTQHLLALSANGNYLLTSDADSLYLYHTPTQTRQTIAHPTQLDVSTKIKAWFNSDEKSWVVCYEIPFVKSSIRAFRTDTNSELDTRTLNRSIANETGIITDVQDNTIYVSSSSGNVRRLRLHSTPTLDSFQITIPSQSYHYWYNLIYWPAGNKIILLGEGEKGKSNLVFCNAETGKPEKTLALSFRASPYWFPDIQNDRILVHADSYDAAALDKGYVYASLELRDTSVWEGKLPGASKTTLACLSNCTYRNGMLLIPCEDDEKTYVVNVNSRRVFHIPKEVKLNWISVVKDQLLYRSLVDKAAGQYSLLNTNSGDTRKLTLPFQYLHLSTYSQTKEPFIIRQYPDSRYDLSRLDSNLVSHPYKRLQFRPDSLMIYNAGKFKDVFYFRLGAAPLVVDDNQEFEEGIFGSFVPPADPNASVPLTYLEHQSNRAQSRFITENRNFGNNTLSDRLKNSSGFFISRSQKSPYGFETIDSLILIENKRGEPLAVADATQVDSIFSYAGNSIVPLSSQIRINKQKNKTAFLLNNTLYLLTMRDKRFTAYQKSDLNQSIGNRGYILINEIGFCNQDKNLFVIYTKGDSLCLNMLDTIELKSVYRYAVKNNRSEILPSPGTPNFLVNDRKTKSVLLFSTQAAKPIALYPWKNSKWLFNDMDCFFNRSGDRFLLAEHTGEWSAYETATGKRLNQLRLADNNSKPVGFSDSESFHFLSASGQPCTWNIRENKSIPFRTENTRQANINEAFLDDGDSLLVTTASNSVQWWNIPKRQLFRRSLLADTSGIFLSADSGYYSINKSIYNEVLYRDPMGRFVTPIQQFDVVYNRPSYFINAANPTLASYKAALEKAYQKRVRRQGAILQPRNSPLLCDVINKRELSTYLHTDTAVIQIGFSGTEGKPINLHVLVNGVPIFGQQGRPLGANTRDTTLQIALTDPENALLVYGTDIAGNSSNYFPLQFVAPHKITNGKLHFIGIGIERFADAQYNLTYSSKDIRDLANKLKERFGKEVSIDTLFNEQVTVDNIRKLKTKLNETSVADKVIISYSGHGLLSKDYDYFLSTYDVNFNQPQSGGLPYAELEGLLDGIPARRKLLLIDACHSGEIDRDEAPAMQKQADSLGLAKGLIKETNENKPKVGLQNSFELMRELFVNVGAGTGSMVISAAAGNQFALERGDLKNGVFTWSVLEALDKFKTIQAGELRRYVSQRVMELTKGLQQPTVRNENQARDWSVW